MAKVIEVPGYGQVEFPDNMTDRQIESAIKSNMMRSDAKERGAAMTPREKGGLTAVQGLTLGFGDELAGLGAGITGAIANLTPWGDGKTFAENYRSARDRVRGATEQYKQDAPIQSTVMNIAGSLPTVLAAPTTIPARFLPNIVGIGTKTGQAVMTGGLYGGVQGVGESTADTVGGVAGDAAKGAAINAVSGAALTGAGNVLGAVGQNVMQRAAPYVNAMGIPTRAATNAAREKVAESIIRDARGTAFQQGASNPLNQASARLNRLDDLTGGEAAIADAAGRNTNALLDTVATLPGRTKDAAENLIHARQAGRGGRLASAADDALGTNNAGFRSTINSLQDKMKADSAPFYSQVNGMTVRVDNELADIIRAAESAHGTAEKLAKLKREAMIDLSKVSGGDSVSFNAMDKVKRSLYDLAQEAKRKGRNEEGMAYDQLRIDLTNKLDQLSPKTQTGESVYKLARDAWAGPSQIKGAVESGREAMKTDSIGIQDLMAGMSASEVTGFRIGALQALRDMTGREAGQTTLLKMWKESATSGKLKEIFGNDYRQFAAAVAAEARLKNLESVGRGSQTASRLYGAGDLDVSAVGDAAGAVASGAQGRLGQMVSGLVNTWNKVKTPEPVRDEIGRILMMRGALAQQELGSLAPMLEQVSAERARRAAQTGAAGILASPLLLPR